MKITSVTPYPLTHPLEVPYRYATGFRTGWSTILVKITAEDGSFGWGEIGPPPWKRIGQKFSPYLF